MNKELYKELWDVSNAELLNLTIAERVQRMAVLEGVKPSKILNALNIQVPSDKDSWEFFDYSIHHYLDLSNLNILTERAGIDIQINDMLDFFQDANLYLTRISSKNLSNWPYLFCAQLQLYCEKLSIPPSTIMCLFAIFYSGNELLSWDRLGWKHLLKQEMIIVNLNNKPNIYDYNKNA